MTRSFTPTGGTSPGDERELARAEWERACQFLRLDATAAGRTREALEGAYAAADRHYHTLDHVADLCRLVCRLANPPAAGGEGAADDQRATRHALIFAAWFHDAIYDTRRADNEERSADWAGQSLDALGAPPALRDRVRQLVLLTKSHRAGADDPDAQEFLDADLAVLGSPPGVYRQYSEAIRREYAWVGEEQYRAGRSAVLRQLLGGGRVFLTEPMQHMLGEQAARNLRGELERLRAGESGAA